MFSPDWPPLTVSGSRACNHSCNRSTGLLSSKGLCTRPGILGHRAQVQTDVFRVVPRESEAVWPPSEEADLKMEIYTAQHSAIPKIPTWRRKNTGDRNDQLCCQLLRYMKVSLHLLPPQTGQLPKARQGHNRSSFHSSVQKALSSVFTLV